MPAESALTDLSRSWRDQLPTKLRRSPDHVAAVHSICREVERVEESIETVRRQFVPQTADVLLPAYESMLKIAVNPPGYTTEQRREAVLAALRQMVAEPGGDDWVANVTKLVGPGWSYREHDPADPLEVAEYTVEVTLPFSADSAQYAAAQRLIRAITPAHLALVYLSSNVLRLDEGQLDIDVMP